MSEDELNPINKIAGTHRYVNGALEKITDRKPTPARGPKVLIRTGVKMGGCEVWIEGELKDVEYAASSFRQYAKEKCRYFDLKPDVEGKT